MDVQLSKDGIPMIIHDSAVDRTTNGSGKISDLSLKEIRFLNAAATFTQFGKQTIPTLEEYFEWCKIKDS